MEKAVTRSVVYVAVGIGAVVIGTVAALLAFYPNSQLWMRRSIFSAYQQGDQYGRLTINYPLDETLFPPEIVAPTFRWQDGDIQSNTWLIVVEFHDDQRPLTFLADDTAWPIPDKQWQVIKNRSVEKPAKVTILGVDRKAPQKILSAGSITISTSKDPVGAPIFYREVNLPFLDAVKDPSKIRWRFGSISSAQRPPIVLENLPVCGNCHSFSTDGKVLGMDVDYANDKGSYAIAPVTEQVVLAKDNIITWNDYKKQDNSSTFGLLSQVSPDGRYVVSTVKDRSVFVGKPDLAFSQLFFPIQGILAVYYRDSGAFDALPGADDPQFVQSNPSWSPDAKHIVFARSKAYHLKSVRSETSVLLSTEECREFLKEGKTFLYDLYRVAFNEGKGGLARPLEGASNNGMSNYFAKYSPDGKWIVFCKASSFMLLQPDSELYIIPAQGGEARRLRCNTNRMNSWHSWSPNSRWLVFSSKVNTSYTQLFLTHIDENGYSTPPVLLERFTAADRAANIPEFLNGPSDQIKKIHEQWTDDLSYQRAGHEFKRAGEFDNAARQFRKALELNPRNLDAQMNLGMIMLTKGIPKQAEGYFAEALKVDPASPFAHNGLGMALFRQGKLDQAIEHYIRAVQLEPDDFTMRYNLGLALFRQDKLDQALEHLSQGLHLQPDNPKVHNDLAVIAARQGKLRQAIKYYSRAIELKADYQKAIYSLIEILTTAEDQNLRDLPRAIELAEQLCKLTNYQQDRALDRLARCYAQAGQFDKAIVTANRALYFARSQGNDQLAGEIKGRIDLYKQGQIVPAN